MSLKIALVTPIFYENAAGGSERHAFEFASILSEKYEVTVLTTAARNSTYWENELKTGEEITQNYKILRFKNKTKRKIHSFNKLTEKLVKKIHSIPEDLEERWLKEQGPYSPELIQFIKNNIQKFDLFFYFTYLYYPTVQGIRITKEKSVCLTTLHDEPPAYFPLYKKILTDRIAYCFNTPEERKLFKQIFGFIPEINLPVGMAVEKKTITNNSTCLNFEYLLYVGRIDRGKGLDELIEFFLAWKNKHGRNNIKLVLAGRGTIEINHPDIIFTGYISEEEKISLIRNSLLLVNPSILESFSIVIMESWIQEKAVLVNGRSDVTREHVKRSNGGFYYHNPDSFIATLEYLLNHPDILKRMGINGSKYVELNYNRESVSNRLFNLIESAYNRIR